MPYLTFGGYSATHGVTRAMRFGNGFRLRRSSTASFILLLSSIGSITFTSSNT